MEILRGCFNLTIQEKFISVYSFDLLKFRPIKNNNKNTETKTTIVLNKAI